MRHTKCGHLTHADCFEQDGTQASFDHCGACTGLYPASSLTKKTAPMVSAPFKEPRITGSHDYVLSPGTRLAPSKIKAVASYIPGISSRIADNVETSKDPFFLIQNRQSLDVIMRRNGIGLDHCLSAGVTTRDFLENGYTWDDLLQFEDVSKKGVKRALQAVGTGLCTTANDFRDYGEAFPFEAVREKTKFKNGDLCRIFGLYFPVNGPLECCGDQDWNAMHCAELGLKMNDLKSFGLRYVQQYQELMDGLTQEEVSDAMNKMGVVEKDVEGLIDLYAEREEEQQQHVAAQPQYVAAKQQYFVEDPAKDEYTAVATANQRNTYNISPVTTHYSSNSFLPPARAVRVDEQLVQKKAVKRFGRHGTFIPQQQTK